MKFYRLIQKKIYMRRIISALISIFLGISIIVGCSKEIKLYLEGPVEVDIYDLDNRQIENYAGKYIRINITDIATYIGGEDSVGFKYGFIPNKKAGWIIGYEGCTAYATAVVAGDDCKKLEDSFNELLKYDMGEYDIRPNINIELYGKVRECKGEWKEYVGYYKKYLLEEEIFTSNEADKIDEIYGTYMIDGRYPYPLANYVGVVFGIILIVLGVVILSEFILHNDYKKINKYIKSFNRKYNSTMLAKDYKKGRSFGNIVVGEYFIYYVKFLNNRMLRIDDIDNVKMTKALIGTKIRFNTVKNKKASIRCKKSFAKKIMKILKEDLEYDTHDEGKQS